MCKSTDGNSLPGDGHLIKITRKLSRHSESTITTSDPPWCICSLYKNTFLGVRYDVWWFSLQLRVDDLQSLQARKGEDEQNEGSVCTHRVVDEQFGDPRPEVIE